METYIFLLFMDMANLKPDIFLIQWSRWIRHNVLEALEEVRVSMESMTGESFLVPLSFVDIFAVACRLCQA